MSLERIVIVGTGQAGVEAALSLRKQGFEGTLQMVGEEPGLPYQRPPLSKAFLKEPAQRQDDILLKGAATYEKRGVEILDGVRITRIDRAARRVEREGGAPLPYDHLILATGARNRTLPVDGGGHAFDLRTVADAETIREVLPGAERVAVVGGGFIGLEVAATARALGAEVVVVEALDRLMARASSEALSERVLTVHREAGIDVRLNTLCGRVHVEGGQAVGVDTADGERVDADVVIVGIGIVPNVELAVEAGLAVGDGIVVDGTLRTADEHISAIGDCASFDYAYTGTRVRLESVQNAVDHGKTVAKAIMGQPEPHAAVPWFWSDQAALKIQMAGLTSGATDRVVLSDEDKGALSVFCFEGPRFLGVETVNHVGHYMATLRALGAGVAPTPELVRSEGFDFKAWMKEAIAAKKAAGA